MARLSLVFKAPAKACFNVRMGSCAAAKEGTRRKSAIRVFLFIRKPFSLQRRRYPFRQVFLRVCYGYFLTEERNSSDESQMATRLAFSTILVFSSSFRAEA